MTLLEISKKYNTDKETRHAYITNFYENALAEYRNKEITLIEIGVDKGDSMRLWRDYFNAANLIGIEINPTNLPDIPNLDLRHGSAYDKNIQQTIPNADIIIDDGPHGQISQIIFLLNYLPKLNKNGLLIIEDIQPQHLPYPIGYDELIFKAFEEVVGVLKVFLGRNFETQTIKPAKQDPSPFNDSTLYCVRRID
jgi:hypothetical protein